jgi:hypothetical protein
MRNLLRYRPSPGMVVAVIAVVLAVGGTAYAALSKKEKKTVKKIADREITAKAPGLSVANSAALGGVPASGYVQGSGKQVTVRGYVDTGGATATLINAAGVGTLTMDCANTGQNVTLTYTNTSGDLQLGNGSVANQGTSSTVAVAGFTLANNQTVSRIGTSAGSSDGHIFTFEALPNDPTGKPGLSFRGTGFTKVHGENRCVVFGVATVG